MNGDAGALERYLAELRGELRARGVDDAGDLAEEIRSHVREAAGGSGDEDAVANALAAFGPPADLAATVASERFAGGLEGGPRQAGIWHRGLAGLMDALLVAGPPVVFAIPAITWLAWVARSVATPEVGLSGALTTPTSLIGLSFTLAMAIWAFVSARGNSRAVRAGRPTTGMRAAGLTVADVGGKRLVVPASTALAVGLPPVRRRGAAIAGVTAAAVIVLAALAWAPMMSIISARSMTENQAVIDAGVGIVRGLYDAALSRDPDEVASLEPVFSKSGTTFKEFAAGLTTDDIRGYKSGGTEFRSVGATESLVVSMQEWAAPDSVSPSYRHVLFTFVRPAGSPASDWTLVKVVRDPLGRPPGGGPSAEEARGLITELVNQAGLSTDDRVASGAEMMTDSFAATDAAKGLLRGSTEVPTQGRVPSIDSIELDGRFAMVRTTEWWSHVGGDLSVGQERHYVYRVLRSRGKALVDGRELVE